MIADATHSPAQDMPDTVALTDHPAPQLHALPFTHTRASRLRQALVEMAVSADAGKEAATSAHDRVSGTAGVLTRPGLTSCSGLAPALSVLARTIVSTRSSAADLLAHIAQLWRLGD